MNTETKPNLEMRNLVVSTPEPLLIKNVLKWEFLKWDLKKWMSILGNEQLQFRRGKNVYTKEPQFENTTDTVCMTFKDFLSYQEKNPQEWLYFDYKYLREWLLNIPELQEHINWKDFGFPELDFEDSTMWIGSKGAHTPCHIDTYGCNIIAQIYGRKRWILFPSSENLHPTRVPYEESSIYSKINLFTPSINDFKNINDCRTVVLNPGDVLILPHKWWHYVENVDLAISINTWIKLPIDHEERVGESIVRLLVSQLAKQLNPEQQQLILNPSNNQDEQISVVEDDATDLITIVLACLRTHRREQSSHKFTSRKFCVEEALKKLKNITVIKRLSEESFKMLLEVQKSKFDYEVEVETIDLEKEDEMLLKKIIDAMLHNDVINLVKEKLLEK